MKETKIQKNNSETVENLEYLPERGKGWVFIAKSLFSLVFIYKK